MVERLLRANASAEKEEARAHRTSRTQAETLVYQAEKQLGELGDKVSAEDKGKVEGYFPQLKGGDCPGRILPTMQ